MNKRILTLVRNFSAPRKLVWEAWTQSEHIAKWWGPMGMKTRVVDLDFKEGGNWKYIMTAPNGSEFPAHGVFTEIIELEKIVSSADFEPVTHGVIITALFEDLDDKTKLTFSVTHPTEEYCSKQEKMGVMNGWGANFDGLENYLSQLP
ncbi:MAG: activator of HSP90 ATPase [Calditrichaeota bacterium]|nr:MAG: activator of HSP90 ATPase [Calditrichota bacterium]MBL1207339.1 activator of HSP90 ATPase [Calditrichota bacterium]NOG47172.1 activator of HSP90 ATPase [Calditrichota bacterium]